MATGLQPGLNWQDLEFYGKVSFMKAGLVFANLLSTVSPTYAREIQTEKFGCGLDGLLRRRHAELRGTSTESIPRSGRRATRPCWPSDSTSRL